MQFGLASQSIRLILVGILMSVALLLPQLNLISHNPIASSEISIERHSILESNAPQDSLHSHHNGTFEESKQLHQHGHNSADHTHLSLNLNSDNKPTLLYAGIKPLDYVRNYLPPPLSLLKRPPKLAHYS